MDLSQASIQGRWTGVRQGMETGSPGPGQTVAAVLGSSLKAVGCWGYIRRWIFASCSEEAHPPRMLSHRDLERARSSGSPELRESPGTRHALQRGGAHASKHWEGGTSVGSERAGSARVCVWARTSGGARVRMSPRSDRRRLLTGELADASARTSGMDICAKVRRLRVGADCSCAG